MHKDSEAYGSILPCFVLVYVKGTVTRASVVFVKTCHKLTNGYSMKRLKIS